MRLNHFMLFGDQQRLTMARDAKTGVTQSLLKKCHQLSSALARCPHTTFSWPLKQLRILHMLASKLQTSVVGLAFCALALGVPCKVRMQRRFNSPNPRKTQCGCPLPIQAVGDNQAKHQSFAEPPAEGRPYGHKAKISASKRVHV